MKKIILLSSLVLLTAASCNKSTVQQPQSNNQSTSNQTQNKEQPKPDKPSENTAEPSPATTSKPTTLNQPAGIKLPIVTTTEKNTCSVLGQTVAVARKSADGAFTSSLTNIDKIAVISTGKFASDPRFTYLWIKDEQRIPVYAPADGTLIKITYKTRVDLSPGLSQPDYDLTFLVDCHTMYRINHITDPNPEIASLKPITEPLQLGNGLPAPSDEDSKPKSNIMVKAGQQIGTTTGTPAAHNWDFGLFIDNVPVCPYEKFNEPLRSAWLALLGDTTKPIEGTPCGVSEEHF